MDIIQLKGVGEKTAKLFYKLNIRTTEDLLSYYPRDYDLFAEPVSLQDAVDGELVAVAGRVKGGIATRRIRSMSITTFSIEGIDGGVLSVTYFNMPYLKKTIKEGQIYVFRGILHRKEEHCRMEHPKMYDPQEYAKLQSCLQPLYPVTKGLSSKTVSKAVRQAMVRKLMPEEYLPERIRHKYDLLPLPQALEQIHFPTEKESLLRARERLVFDEFFLFLLMLRSAKDRNEEILSDYIMLDVAQTGRLIEALPYRLTKAQQKVWGEIRDDLTSSHAMNRLVQGDVGSGKTILAFLALLMCSANGCQGALMAPTEVLAQQHYETVCKLKEKYHLEIHPVLLTGSTTQKDRRSIYKEIEDGQADIVIGTHALIQDKVIFHKLALVITDEQHRFGVRQRAELAMKGEGVHVLVMSATPIPRTLATILYGDLHISVLDEQPAERLAIKNCVVNTGYRQTAYKFMQKEIAEGRQVYVICPMVEEGESAELEDVQSYKQKLEAYFPESIRIGCLHGRMRPADKTRIMEEFSEHKIDILVSTTVVEVGVNVPNATVMLIENAERFGLAQLHQLRGRVGRGKWQSYCIFMTKSDKPEKVKRLNILKESNDGFYIAGEDLKLRGPGDLLGVRQSGEMNFRLGDIYQDAGLLQKASEEADILMKEDPALQLPENQILAKVLKQTAINEVDFGII